MAEPIEKTLHKGAGVRRPDLVRALAGPFADRLHVFEDESSPYLVRAKVIWQLSAVIKKVPCTGKWITVLETSYNLPRDPELNRQPDLKGRLEFLHKRHKSSPGWNPSTTNSMLSTLRREHVFPMLQGTFEWAPENEIEEIARLEEEYDPQFGKVPADHRTITVPKDAFEQLMADTSRPRRRGLLTHLLPQESLHFAVSARGNLVTTHTVEFGETLAAFTSESLLKQYLAEVRASESDIPTVAAGRRVINVLVTRGRVGLAVNPLGGEAYGGQHWTAEELVDLWTRD